jgi:DNA-binding NarL/FixJ family response regulator
MNTMLQQHPIRILCADDHPLMRDGIAFALQKQSDMQLVAEASTGREAIEAYRKHRPDITLMDLQMPDLGGIEAITAIRQEFPHARIIVLTTFRGDVQAARALKAGASGYLLKDMLRTELVNTIRAVHAGQRRIPQEVAAQLAEHVIADSLSGRELDVLRSVASGCSNKIIADRLSITEHTVKGHMKNILSKLQANDRTQAALIALKRGFFES